MFSNEVIEYLSGETLPGLLRDFVKGGAMMHLLKTIATILLVVGGLNLGLTALLDMNVVELVFGSYGFAVDGIYTLVGISAVYYIIDGKLFDF